jgi:hypothetical protein
MAGNCPNSRCALRAVDKGEVFLTQRFDEAIDVIGGVLLEPGPESPVFVVILLSKLLDP